MRPGPVLPRLLLLLALSALVVPVLPGFAPVAYAVLLALLLAVGTEAALLSRVRLTVDRRESLALALGQPESIDLSLRTNSRRAVSLEVRQVWPRLLDSLSTTRRAVCRAGEHVPLAFPVRPIARGHASIPPLHAAATFWGLWERILSAGEASELLVLPDLRAVGRLHETLNRFSLRGIGTRSAVRLGKGREFDRLREYVMGDEFRDIAWRASARHGKLITREFRLDRSQDVVVCLDRGHRMAALVAGISRLDHAVNATLLLAYMCNRMEDKIGVLSFATDVTVGVKVGRGTSHLRRLTSFAASVEAESLHTDYRALAAELRRRQRHRTLLVLLTSLPDMETQALLEAVRTLIPQHLPLVVVLADPVLRAVAETRPLEKEQLDRVLVASEVLLGRATTIRELRKMGALVVETAPQDAGVAAMNAYIDVKRRQLL